MIVWDIVTLLSKSLTYMAMLAIPGGFFVLALQRRASRRLEVPNDQQSNTQLLLYFLLPMLIVGIVSVCLFFLAQVGAVNQQGIAGMLDRQMGEIMASTALGEGVQWRLNGFLLAATALGLLLLSQRLPGYQRQLERLVTVLVVSAAVVFAWSFAILGHTNNLALDVRLAITFHVIAVSLWIGALYPLYRLCGLAGDSTTSSGDNNTDVLALLMQDFGRAGWGFISVLLATGLYLILALLGSWDAMFSTDYGRLLLLKQLLVSALLALGSLNKFRLVPALHNAAQREAAIPRLRRSIAAEMVLAVFVLLVTAGFTTVTGPAM